MSHRFLRLSKTKEKHMFVFNVFSSLRLQHQRKASVFQCFQQPEVPKSKKHMFFRCFQQPEAPNSCKSSVSPRFPAARCSNNKDKQAFSKFFSSQRPRNGVKFVRGLWRLKFVMRGASWVTVVQERRFWMLFGRSGNGMSGCRIAFFGSPE